MIHLSRHSARSSDMNGRENNAIFHMPFVHISLSEMSLLSTMESLWKATRQSFLSHYTRTTSASCTEGILVLKLLDEEGGIVFWPTMTDDINKETESCSVCNSTILHQQKRTTPATSSFRPALVNCGNRHLRMAQSAVLGASWLIFRLVWDWPASWCNLCNSYHKTTTKKHHTLSY